MAGDVELVHGDVRDPDAVRSAMKDAQRVIHLAYVNGTRWFYERPELVLEVAVKGMVNVLDACRENGVGELVLASSSEVYQTPPRIPTDERVPLVVPDPLNPRYSYGGGKIASELLAINYGRTGFERVLVFRPHNVYGPDMGWEHVIPQLTMRVRDGLSAAGAVRVPIQGTGAETRAFIYVDDLVAGVLILLESGKHLGIYNVGTEQEVSVADLVRAIGRCFGREAVPVPGERPKGSVERRAPDTAKLRALGFTPRVPLTDGLAATVRWYDEHADERPV